MWLCTKGGFVSAVVHQGKRGDPNNGKIVVRARERSALVYVAAAVDRRVKIHEHQQRDYRFRVYLRRDEWAGALVALADDVDYPNFKDAVLEEAKRGHVSPAYERALHKVWGIFGELQEGGPYGWLHAPKRRKRRRGRRAARAERQLLDVGVRELDLGEFGTWPADGSARGALSLDDEFAGWLDAHGIEADELTHREQQDLVGRWIVDADPNDQRFVEEADRRG